MLFPSTIGRRHSVSVPRDKASFQYAENNEQQRDLQFSSLEELVKSTQGIKNVATQLVLHKSCIIKTNQYHYELSMDNEEINIIRDNKPSSCLWAGIMHISSSSAAQQLLEDTLKFYVKREVSAIIRKMVDDAVTTAEIEQRSMTGKYWRIVDGAKKDIKVTEETEETENCRITGETENRAWLLIASLKKLPHGIIDNMRLAKNKECLDELDAKRRSLNEQQQSVLKLFVEGKFDAALQELLQAVNSCGDSLINTSNVPEIQDSLNVLETLASLSGQLIDAGASPAVVFEYSWLVAIIKHTHADHKKVAVNALGDGALKKAVITELNKLLPDHVLPESCTLQEISTTWQSLPAPRTN